MRDISNFSTRRVLTVGPLIPVPEFTLYMYDFKDFSSDLKSHKVIYRMNFGIF